MEKAPLTCAALCGLLPLEAQAIQARWSGESAWAPIDDIPLEVEFENATSYPAPGELLLYPGGYSEREILLPLEARVSALPLVSETRAQIRGSSGQLDVRFESGANLNVRTLELQRIAVGGRRQFAEQ